MRDWAKTVKRLRDKLMDSQAEFGERLGVNWTTVSRWERGVTVPQPAMQRLILGMVSDAARDAEGGVRRRGYDRERRGWVPVEKEER